MISCIMLDNSHVGNIWDGLEITQSMMDAELWESLHWGITFSLVMGFSDDDLHLGIATSKSLYWCITLSLMIDFQDDSLYWGIATSFLLMEHCGLGVVRIILTYIHFFEMWK